jgi:hypothetical protein
VPLSRLQRGSGTVDPTFGASAEHPLAGGRWVTSFAARTPVAENADGLRTGSSSELGTGWAHYAGTHRVIAVLAGKGINVQAEVKLPAYRNLPNRQLDSRATFQVGLSRSF